MNEFKDSPSQLSDDIDVPVPQHRENSGVRYLLLERKYFLGLTGPWLLGFGVLLIVMAWYLIGSTQPAKQNVNDLAGFDNTTSSAPASPASQTQSNTLPNAPAQSSGGDAQIRDDVAKMVNGVRDYSQANRTAIQRLSDAVKALSQEVANQQQITGQYQTQIASLNARIAELEANRVNGVTPHRITHRSPTSGMRLNAVEDGMAWILWNGKTWAVKEGDQLGNVTVTQIDAPDRQVFTSAGVIR